VIKNLVKIIVACKIPDMRGLGSAFTAHVAYSTAQLEGLSPSAAVQAFCDWMDRGYEHWTCNHAGCPEQVCYCACGECESDWVAMFEQSRHTGRTVHSPEGQALLQKCAAAMKAVATSIVERYTSNVSESFFSTRVRQCRKDMHFGRNYDMMADMSVLDFNEVALWRAKVMVQFGLAPAEEYARIEQAEVRIVIFPRLHLSPPCHLTVRPFVRQAKSREYHRNRKKTQEIRDWRRELKAAKAGHSLDVAAAHKAKLAKTTKTAAADGTIVHLYKGLGDELRGSTHATSVQESALDPDDPATWTLVMIRSACKLLTLKRYSALAKQPMAEFLIDAIHNTKHTARSVFDLVQSSSGRPAEMQTQSIRHRRPVPL
jgi:hypothetical protein